MNIKHIKIVQISNLFSYIRIYNSYRQVLLKWTNILEEGKGVGGRVRCKECIHMYVNAKMYLLKLFRGGGWKRAMGVRIQVWCIWYIVRTFENATMYPHPIQQ
jgi:hypothetical protein